MAATEGYDELIANSHHVRRELEEGQVSSFTPYVPTDWGKETAAEQREFYGGFDPKRGTCPECFQIYSASGNCGC